MDKFVTRMPRVSTSGTSTRPQRKSIVPARFRQDEPLPKLPLREKRLSNAAASSNLGRRLSIRDEKLLEIFNSQPDQPLLEPDSLNDEDSGLSSSSSAATERFQQQTAKRRLSMTSANDENRPLAMVAGNKTPMGQLSDYVNSALETNKLLVSQMSSSSRIDEALYADVPHGRTAGNEPSTPRSQNVMARIRTDLNSPSAAIRMRALKALRSPTKSAYSAFDVPHEEQNIISAEERHAPQSKLTIQEIMRNVVVYVEVRTGEDNRSAGVKKVISLLGARVNDKLLRDTTHVIFKDGLLSTYKKAKTWKIPIVSILWVEACKTRHMICDPSEFPISNIDRYENPELYGKLKRHKSMQPDSECNKRKRVKPGTPKDCTPRSIAETLKKASSLIGDTPKLGFNKKTVDISQYMKRYDRKKPLIIDASGATPSTPTLTTPTGTDNGIFDSPATQLLNKINASCFTPFGKVNMPENTKSEKETRTAAILTNEEDTPADGLKQRMPASAQQPTTATHVINGRNGAPSDDDNCSVSKPSNTSFETGDTEISKGNSESDSSTCLGSKTSNRRSSIHVTRSMSVSTSYCETPEKDIRRKLTVFNDCLTIEEEDTIAAPPTPNNNDAPTETVDENADEKGSEMSQKHTHKRRSTYTNKPCEISEVEDAATPKARPTARRRTLYTPMKMEISNAIEEQSPKRCNSSPARKEPASVSDCDITQSAPSMATKVACSTMIDEVTPTRAYSLIAEHAAATIFNSVRQPGQRRTIFDVSMDIISQRMQNINKSARRSLVPRPAISDLGVRPDPTDPETPVLHKTTTTPNIKLHYRIGESQTKKSKSPRKNERAVGGSTKKEETPVKPAPHKAPKKSGAKSPSIFREEHNGTPPAVTKKRKLFMPNDMLLTPPVTTSTQTSCTASSSKRRRTVMGGRISQDSVKPRPSLSAITRKSPKIRVRPRSMLSMDSDSSNDSRKIMSKMPPKAPPRVINEEEQKIPYLVCTNMHKDQMLIVREAVEKLGGFQLDHFVTGQTSHVVSYEARRTLNLLRALARGLWILEFEWVLASMRAGHWVNEERYELKDFSRAVQICRAERQAFGSSYKCELFNDLGSFYVSSRCGPISKDNVRELIELCGGKVVDTRRRARYIMGDSSRTMSEKLHVTPFWILDSITQMQVLKFQKYLYPTLHQLQLQAQRQAQLELQK